MILTSRAGRAPLLATLRQPDGPQLRVAGSAVAVLALALSVPAIREMFASGPLSGEVFGIAAVVLSLAFIREPAHSRKVQSVDGWGILPGVCGSRRPASTGPRPRAEPGPALPGGFSPTGAARVCVSRVCLG